MAGAAAYLVTGLLQPPPSYQAQAVALVGPALDSTNPNVGQLETARRFSEIYVEMSGARPLLERVADAVGYDGSAENLGAQLTVTTLQEPPILTVAVVDTDPERAADIANEVVRQLTDIAPDIEGGEADAQEFIDRQAEALRTEIEALVPEVEALTERTTRTSQEDERLAELQARLAELRGTYAALVAASAPTSSGKLTVIEEAVANTQPLPGARTQSVLLAAVVGFVLAAAVAFLVESLDDRVRAGRDLEAIKGLRSLGELPRIPRRARARLPTILSPESSTSDGFHALRTNIEMTAAESLRSLVITSPSRGDGRSTVAAHLAVAFAQSGRRVLLVDADLRQPAVHKLFALSNQRGLHDMLRRPAAVKELIQETSLGELLIVSSGVPAGQPSEAVTTARMKEVNMRLERLVDLVIYDAPPVRLAPETMVVASLADSTLVVVAAGRTTFDAVRESYEALQRVRAPVVGAVLNRPARGIWLPTPTAPEPGELATARLGDDQSSSP